MGAGFIPAPPTGRLAAAGCAHSAPIESTGVSRASRIAVIAR